MILDIEERDKHLLVLSLHLHEVLLYQFARHQSSYDTVDIEEFIEELADIKIRLSSLIDHYWRYGRSFVKPIAEMINSGDVEECWGMIEEEYQDFIERSYYADCKDGDNTGRGFIN